MDKLKMLERTVEKLKLEEGKPLVQPVTQSVAPNWGAYAVEDWIVLKKDEWGKLLPEGDVTAGTAWDPDKEVAAKVQRHYYPSTENNNVAKNRIGEQQLRATVLSVKDGVVRARIDGALKMKHPCYHKDDDNVVDATIVGILDYDQATKNIRSLQLAPDKANYGRTTFGVVVRSEP